MASDKTRLAVIISQETFELPNVENRKGNEHDVNQLESTLKEFGFIVRIFEDQNKQDILSILKAIALETQKNLECILVIVLSHGDSGGVLFANDQEFYTKDVWGPFRDSAKLNDIPKVFIFQACRGIKEEKTFHPILPTEPKKQETSQTVPVLPQKSGFLLVHSTIAGHISKRNHDTGTVFIQTLCNEMSAFHKNYGEINFLSLLTEVNNKVTTMANRDGGSQTSTFTSFLRQPLILKTKNDVDAEQSSTSHDSNDAAGGNIKTSYEHTGSNLILILYAEKYKDQYESLNLVLNHQHFTVKSILVNNIEDIYGLSRRNIFENVRSFTVIVLAEMFEEKITDYCEKLFVEFSRLIVQLNDIWSQFTASQCDQLRGKPKLFFFFDLLERRDCARKDSHEGFENIESVNNHSDFIWTYCYGKRMFDEIKRALTDPCEEITQLLTTAMRRANITCKCSKGGRSSHFESTLRLQFYYQSHTQEMSGLNLREKVLSDLNDTSTEADALCPSKTSDADLHATSESRDITTMQLLLQRTRSVISINVLNRGINQFTPLHKACLNGKTEDVKSLLSSNDCSVNICTKKYKNTVLHFASGKGYVEIMQLILQRDQSLLNMQNNYGNTALYLASNYGNDEAGKFLLSYNDCSVNICNNRRDTVLHAASNGGCVETMQLILQRDQSLLNMQNKQGFTPLHHACRNGRTEAVKFLLSQSDCLFNVRDYSLYRHTALNLAKGNRHYEIIQLLLQHGAENKMQCTCV